MAFLFIFLIGIFLIVFNVKALKKEKVPFDNMLSYRVDNMNEVEIKLGELRREFTEDIFELQKEIEQLKTEKNIQKYASSTEVIPESIDNIYNNEIINNELDKNSLYYEAENNNVKVNEIGRLLKQGLDIDEVAEKLSIGKGEVLLIKELYLK